MLEQEMLADSQMPSDQGLGKISTCPLYTPDDADEKQGLRLRGARRP